MIKPHCPFCAGKDKDDIPINCLICITNPKYRDRRKIYLEELKNGKENRPV